MAGTTHGDTPLPSARLPSLDPLTAQANFQGIHEMPENQTLTPRPHPHNSGAKANSSWVGAGCWSLLPACIPPHAFVSVPDPRREAESQTTVTPRFGSFCKRQVINRDFSF